MIQNLWDDIKWKFIQFYLRKQGKSQINNLILHLKEIEKEKQTKSKVSTRNVIKSREKINKMETLENNLKDAGYKVGIIIKKLYKH